MVHILVTQNEQNLDSKKEKKLSIQIEKKENSLFVLRALH